MKITVEKVNSGLACGKQYIRFTNDSGETIGCIQPLGLEFYGIGCTTMYAVKEYTNYRTKLCDCLASAITYLFNTTNLDEIDSIVADMVCQIGAVNIDKERQWL